MATVTDARYGTLVLTSLDFDARGILAGDAGLQRAQAWSERARNTRPAQGVGGGTQAGGQGTAKVSALHGRPPLGARAPPLDREAAIAAAIEGLKVGPTERIRMYRRMRDLTLRLIRAHQTELAEREFKEGLTIGTSEGLTAEERAAQGISEASMLRIQREKMIATMGGLNALLKFLPAEVRGKVGGFFLHEKRLPEFFLQRITERPKPSAGLSSAASQATEQLHKLIVCAMLMLFWIVPAAHFRKLGYCAEF